MTLIEALVWIICTLIVTCGLVATAQAMAGRKR